MGWTDIFASWRVLLVGFENTLLLSVASIITGTTLGLLVGFARAERVPVLAPVLRVYLEIFRGSPLLIQMLFVYFGAAYLNVSGVTTFVAALIALTLYEGALISEIFRAGIESIPRGQREAGRSLGLSRLQIARSVVLPQTMSVVIPPLVGQYIGLVKDTALATVIGYADLLRQGQAVIDRIGMPFQVFFATGIMYFIVCYLMSLAARRLERSGARA